MNSFIKGLTYPLIFIFALFCAIPVTLLLSIIGVISITIILFVMVCESLNN